VDFSDTRHTRTRICLIGNSKLSQIVHSLIPEFAADAHIRIIDHTFNDAVRSARELVRRDEVDIFISAGANAFYLQDTLPIPVLALKVEQADLIQAVMTAQRIATRILLLTYERQPIHLEFLSLFPGLEITHHTYSTAEHAKEVFHRVRNEGFGVVIGSSYACDLAEQWGLDSVLIYSRQSCRNLLRKALRHAAAYKRHAELVGLVQFLLEQSPRPLVLTHHGGRVLAWNKSAAVLLPHLSERRRLDAMIERKLLDPHCLHAEGVLVGERLCSLRKQAFVVAGESIGMLYTFVPSPVAMPAPDERRMLSASSCMAEVQQQLGLYAATPGHVLLVGETGTGKELAARQIHTLSANAKGPFIAINCAAIPAELFESELFGHAEGAFTGARTGGKSGLIESANHGAFFMDEINALPLPQQAKLLRVLQEREMRPVGSRRQIPLDIKFIAACNVDLTLEVRAGRFREDLYWRISAFSIHIPPLRERREDIALLTDWLLRRESGHYGIDLPLDELIAQLTPVFARYHWPGNVRQMENLIERLVVSYRLYGNCDALLQALPRIAPELYAPLPGACEPGGHLKQVEREEVSKALQLFGGNRHRAAEYLGISQTTLWRRLKREQTLGPPVTHRQRLPTSTL